MSLFKKLLMDAIVVGGLLLFIGGGVNWFIKKEQRYTAAYAHLFDDLKLKSKAHLNLIDYYETCIRLRPGKSSRMLSSPICMEKTRGWAEKLNMKGPVDTVMNDIGLAESKAYLETKN